jgi:hypothetical protein
VFRARCPNDPSHGCCCSWRLPLTPPPPPQVFDKIKSDCGGRKHGERCVMVDAVAVAAMEASTRGQRDGREYGAPTARCPLGTLGMCSNG